jgi:hypothetical protein
MALQSKLLDAEKKISESEYKGQADGVKILKLEQLLTAKNKTLIELRAGNVSRRGAREEGEKREEEGGRGRERKE